MEQIEFPLKAEFIEVNNLLKLTGLAGSGGQGKHLVACGEVKVDGKLESRKTAKIRPGQVVECFDTRIVVVAEQE
ncbi:MAG TPA: RNA-binding S4 domain-containing protein [Rhodocyclaceae bacterium]|jgi:ribosome-associated protein